MMNVVKTDDVHILLSRLTQLFNVDCGIADSSQSKLITICLSSGASSLLGYCQMATDILVPRNNSTEIMKDMKTVSDTILSTYFATGFEETAVMHEVHDSYLYFRSTAEQKA